MAEIQVLKNGPYAMDAQGMKVVDLAGNEIKPGEGDKVFLCRCGQSANKPFCDGSHSTTSFRDDPTA